MKGIIFNLVEDAVVAEHGEAVWDTLLDAAGLEGAYTALGDYPDADLVALVGAGAAALDVTPDDLTRHLGSAALLGLQRRYPQFFEPHTSAGDFLLTLNDVIHPEVRKLHRNASPPDFWFDGQTPDSLVIHYRSRRRLCALAEGMIVGAAAHYGQTATLEQTSCMNDGADHCVIHASFAASFAA
ncbi:heme NO-binding domain-containing protein [Nocardioides sp. KIGAM211]|uniref:Heme NO-binding domain-containing protein n=1 Tax=Nocardioides luti TaxID=2761101 RepID=A0A7X0VC19_9ACTN|nr:heme NO-binding domain-containing protein [Nocardioides luti]MBB6629291.1 heme NO-binding domain-containing protein [Nocardioides luti]